MSKISGYNEWISPETRIGFISNCFNNVIYVNQNWPDGDWINALDLKLDINMIKKNCTKGRTFNKEELMLELL